jgi:hypothetical protein
VLQTRQKSKDGLKKNEKEVLAEPISKKTAIWTTTSEKMITINRVFMSFLTDRLTWLMVSVARL